MGVLILALGLLASGCGGGGEGSETVSKSLRRQANLTCAKVNLQVARELLKAYNSEPIKKAASEREGIDLEVRMLLPIVVQGVESLVEGFRTADRSSADTDQATAIVSAYDNWIDDAKSTPRQVVLRNDTFNTARRLASEYGIEQCARSPFEVNREG